MMRRLIPDRKGAAAIEFALLAPVFFAFIFLLLEGGRMVWTQQVLQETAVASVRCLVLKNTGCMTDAEVQSWTVQHAGQSGVTLTTAGVGLNANIACNGRAGMKRVILTLPYASAVGTVLPAAPSTLTATACFPNV